MKLYFFLFWWPILIYLDLDPKDWMERIRDVGAGAEQETLDEQPERAGPDAPGDDEQDQRLQLQRHSTIRSGLIGILTELNIIQR
jgi:hypothetical protein